MIQINSSWMILKKYKGSIKSIRDYLKFFNEANLFMINNKKKFFKNPSLIIDNLVLAILNYKSKYVVNHSDTFHKDFIFILSNVKKIAKSNVFNSYIYISNAISFSLNLFYNDFSFIESSEEINQKFKNQLIEFLNNNNIYPSYIFFKIDPSLINGFRIYSKNKRIDFSFYRISKNIEYNFNKIFGD